jgi:hypothetical protein
MHAHPRFREVLAMLVLALPGLAAPSTITSLPGGITMVADDTGAWDGHMSLSVTHQNSAPYQARKVLDLSALPENVWTAAKEFRVSAFFAVRDYSWHDQPATNGLDEALEIVVNGTVNTYPTNCGAPVYQEGAAANLGWYDFALPREQFRRGVNEIILRKARSDKDDDYLYLGIDHSRELGNSAVDFGDGKGWRQDTLTVPGGRGEYLIRLYLVSADLAVEASWRPGVDSRATDPAGLFVFHGSRYGQATAEGLVLEQSQSAQLE